jgi:dimethylaniline monooxygenase (N-oxide forming)
VNAPRQVCLIGAGASGITTARSLSARDISFDWFDRGDRVGGIWVFASTSGLSPAYRHLHINVSRERMEFSDFPMPKWLPTYPSHRQIAAYFQAYVRHFELDRHLQMQMGVARAWRQDGMWNVELDDGRRHVYDALVVANGHHSVPRWPEPPPRGEFVGEQIHSCQYREESCLRDRDVVVVGLGNSACDIAVESSFAARHTYLSVRRGAHVLPKMMWRWPYDQVPGLTYAQGRGIGVGRFGVQIPWLLRQLWLEAGHRLSVGKMEIYGLPNPTHRFGATHPTISPRLLERMLHGTITPRPGVERLDGQLVHFADGTCAPADLIVWCTGYEFSFPFLTPDLVPVDRDNHVQLYWNVFSTSAPNLAFIGLIQPAAGSTMQIAEGQGKWVAAYLAGEYALPSKPEMRAHIERRRRLIARRHAHSARHTVQLEQADFLWRLRGELHRGRRRARRTRSHLESVSFSG